MKQTARGTSSILGGFGQLCVTMVHIFYHSKEEVHNVATYKHEIKGNLRSDNSNEYLPDDVAEVCFVCNHGLA